MDKFIILIAQVSWPRGLVFALLVGAVYYFLAYNDGTQLKTQLQQAEVAEKSAESSLKQTKTAVADANRFEREVKELAEQFREITKFMPDKMRAAELTTMISDLSARSGVRLKSTEPQKSSDTSHTEAATFYDTTRLRFTVEGKFPQIVMLLSYLTRTSKLLTLENVSLRNDVAVATDIESPKLTFSAVIVGYRFLEDDKNPAADAGGKPKAALNAPIQSRAVATGASEQPTGRPYAN